MILRHLILYGYTGAVIPASSEGDMCSFKRLSLVAWKYIVDIQYLIVFPAVTYAK
jgi:hypothetical protein